jgi:hypothetical protein
VHTSGYNFSFSGGNPSTAAFVYGFLRHIINGSGDAQAKSIATSFLRFALDIILQAGGEQFQELGTPGATAREILNASGDNLLGALGVTITEMKEMHRASIVIDGIDKMGQEGARFVKNYCLHMKEIAPDFKALLTSKPKLDIKRIADGMLSIEYDKERLGMIIKLYTSL